MASLRQYTLIFFIASEPAYGKLNYPSFCALAVDGGRGAVHWMAVGADLYNSLCSYFLPLSKLLHLLQAGMPRALRGAQVQYWMRWGTHVHTHTRARARTHTVLCS